MKQLFRNFFLFYISVVTFDVSAQVSFENVTSEMGPFHTGESWGVAWGDINNDYYPDIASGNHRHRQSMWINQAGEKFRDGILQFDRDWIYLSDHSQDSHGVSFADIDNNGYQDLIGARSSSGGRAQIFLNDQGVVTEHAVSLGITGRVGAGRLGVLYDYNRDGLLDFLYASSSRLHNTIFRNNGNNTFTNVTPSSFTNLSGCGSLNYYQFSNIDGDTSGVPNLDINCFREGTFPKTIYDTSAGTIPFADITNTLPSASNTVDTVFGDFDNDGDNDIIAIRGALRTNGASLVSPTQIEAWITSSSTAGEKSFTFESSGSISFESIDVSRDRTPIDQIRIGSSENTITSLPITLDKNSPFAQGISTSTSKGVYIGYDTVTSKWTLRVTSTDFEDYYLALSGNGLTEPADFVLSSRDMAHKPIFFENKPTGFDRVFNFGVGEVFCNSITAGDFDNDMDLDIYMACGAGVANIKNRLYLNDGTGDFEEVLVHGAEGIIGAGIEQSAGVAESVIMADYDIDGRLDLFTSNGMLYQPDFIGGPDELFRNTTDNSNNWIELDLIGVNVNRDAMGAKIIATAGGVDQIREQNYGYHRWSQNHKRIHFGLGQNSIVDVTVVWPDGTEDTYSNVAANSLYEVEQGGEIQQITPSGFNEYPEPQSGEECSDRGQAYLPELDRAVFLSKDCSSGLWSLRVVAGNSDEPINYSGYILAGQNIVSVNEYNTEGSDFANLSDRRIDFSLTLSGLGEDGFDFDLGTNSTACILVENEGSIVVGEYHLLAPNKLDLIQMGACDLNPDGSLNVPAITTTSINTDSLVIPGSGGSVTHDIDLSDLDVNIGDTVFVNQLVANGDLNNNVGSEFFSLDFNSGEYEFNQIQTGVDCSGVLEPTTTELSQNITVIDIGGGVPGIRIFGQTTPDVDSSCFDVDYQLTISVETVNTAVAACGIPTYSISDGPGLYVWKDCGVTDNWFVRANAGGGAAITYVGEFLAENPMSSVIPFSFEGIDQYDLSLSDKLMSFTMKMANNGEDGLEFALENNSELCLSLSDPTQNIYVGEDKNAFTSSVNLNDISSACVTPDVVPTLSASNVIAAEALGEAIVTVNLSEISNDTITVDYTTVDDSAVAGQDYTLVSDTLTFNPGELSQTISIPLAQDIYLEESESFNVLLSNSTNADIVSSSISVTIDDAGCISPANGDDWFYQYYEGVWNTVPNFDNEILIQSGTTDEISTDPAISADFYGLRFVGCIDVPLAGNYTFNTTSDDGSLLYVDNNLVVDNDGLHAVQTVTSEYFLTAGIHQIRVDFFEQSGQDVLSADWIAPSSDTLVCGTPDYTPSQDAGLFLWQDCSGDDTWNIRATAGGGSAITYTGTINTDSPITILSEFSFEGIDNISLSNSDLQADFLMRMSNNGEDGFNFDLGTGDACLDIDLPAGQQVIVGETNNAVTPPFNIKTLDPC